MPEPVPELNQLFIAIRNNDMNRFWSELRAIYANYQRWWPCILDETDPANGDMNVLHEAASISRDGDRLEMIKTLLMCGAHPNRLTSGAEWLNRKTPLDLAEDEQVMECLELAGGVRTR